MKYIIANKSPEALWIDKDLLTNRIDNSYYRLQFIESDLNNKDIPKKLLKDILKSPLTDFGSFSLTKEIEYVREGIPYIRSSDFKEFFIEEENICYITEEVNKILSKSEVFEGDILITKMGSDMGKAAYISKLPFSLGKCNSNATIAKVRVKDEFDKHYIVAYLNSKYAVNNVWRNAVGSVQPRVNLSDIENYIIAIPSPEIQKYIGNKVRKAEELREEAKILKKEAEDILSSELGSNKLNEKLNFHTEKYSWTKAQDLSNRIDGEFYKTEFVLNNEYLKGLNSQGIQVINLKNIILNGSYGILPSSSDYGKGEVELLRSTNIKEFLIDDSDVIKVSEDYYKDKVKICNGDILLEIKGQCYAGAVAENIRNKTIINGSIFKFSVKKEFNNYYVLGYLLSQSGQLQKKQNLANSIISYLSIACINELQIPILNKEKQDIIGEKYRRYVQTFIKSKELIKEAKQYVEDLIEGNFDMSKIKKVN